MPWPSVALVSSAQKYLQNKQEPRQILYRERERERERDSTEETDPVEERNLL